MKYSTSITKKSLLTVLVSAIVSCVCCLHASAQQKTGQDHEIFWENGDMTTLQDLGKVWISLKKGRDIKNVKIWEIQPKSFMIVYEQNGTLHDLLMSKVAHIGTGRISKSHLYFDQNGVPHIKPNPDYMYSFEVDADFKVTRKAVSVTATPDPVNEAKELAKDSMKVNVTMETPLDTGHPAACDTIVRVDGEVLVIKVLSISTSEIRYKRTDIPESPIYSINNTPETRVVRYPKGLKIIQK